MEEIRFGIVREENGAGPKLVLRTEGTHDFVLAEYAPGTDVVAIKRDLGILLDKVQLALRHRLGGA